ETFAYAEGWDEQRQRYQGLRAAQSIRVIADDRALLVKPEVAAAQLAADQQSAATAPGATTQSGSTSSGGAVSTDTFPSGQTGDPPAPPASQELRRFHGSVKVEPLRLGRDAARIAEEVVQHLTGLVGANVEITIEIQADLAEGANDKLVRDVTENCRTLKFTD